MNKLLLSLICVTSLAASIPAFAGSSAPAAPAAQTAQGCIKNFQADPRINPNNGVPTWFVVYSNGCDRPVKMSFKGFCYKLSDSTASTFTSLTTAGKGSADLSCTASSKPTLGQGFNASF